MRRALLAAGLVIGLAGAEAAHAQSFGAEAMFGSDTDFGLGGRVHIPLGTTIPLELQGGFALFFPDGPADYWEVNGNLWYLIDTGTGTNVVPYAGGGLNFGVVDAGSGFGNETEVGLNLGGGARFVIAGVEQFVIGGGVMFGGF